MSTHGTRLWPPDENDGPPAPPFAGVLLDDDDDRGLPYHDRHRLVYIPASNYGPEISLPRILGGRTQTFPSLGVYGHELLPLVDPEAWREFEAATVRRWQRLAERVRWEHESRKTSGDDFCFGLVPSADAGVTEAHPRENHGYEPTPDEELAQLDRIGLTLGAARQLVAPIVEAARARGELWRFREFKFYVTLEPLPNGRTGYCIGIVDGKRAFREARRVSGITHPAPDLRSFEVRAPAGRLAFAPHF